MGYFNHCLTIHKKAAFLILQLTIKTLDKTVNIIECHMDKKAQSYQSKLWHKKHQSVNNNGDIRMKWMKAHTTTIWVVDWIC